MRTLLLLGFLAIPTLSAAGTLRLEAHLTTGAPMTLNDFVSYTADVASNKWTMYQNYGVFPVGTAPATVQAGGPIFSIPNGGQEYVAMSVPANQAFYFTALWRVNGAGTVFLRADNGGTGYTVADGGTLTLQIPYEFALSEYALASRMVANAATAGDRVSNDSKSKLAAAAALVDSAKNATTPSARAAAAYQALAAIVPLKEQIVLENSNGRIAKSGERADFVLNYEGFGSWTDTRFTAQYQGARAAGFGSVLTRCDWTVVSPSNGTYNFSSLDYQIDQAMAQGFAVALNVGPAVGQLPGWTSGLTFDQLKALYYENARVVVDRYKNKVTWFYPAAELELETKTFTLAQVAELARQALLGARAAAAGKAYGYYASAAAYVGYQMNRPAGATLYSSLDLLRYMRANGTVFDFVGLEMQYATVFAPIDLQRMGEVLEAVREVAQVPLSIGETGYSAKTEEYGLTTGFFWRDGLTRKAQAEWADGTLRLAYGLAYVKGLYWVHLDPDDSDRGSPFLSTLVGTGLYRSNGTERPALAAFREFSTKVKGLAAGVAGAADKVTATACGGQATKTGLLFATDLQATVTDFLGTPVPGAFVQFTAPATGASGTFSNGFAQMGAVATNAGVATAPPLRANGTAGTFTVTATTGTATAASFSLTNTASTAPRVAGLAPVVSAGASGSFTFQFTDAEGFEDLEVLNILINTALDGRGACYLAYVRGVNILYLVNDAGDAAGPYAGSMVMNGTGSVQNSQCVVSGAGSSVTGSGNTLTLTLNLSFSAGSPGEPGDLSGGAGPGFEQLGMADDGSAGSAADRGGISSAGGDGAVIGERGECDAVINVSGCGERGEFADGVGAD